MGFFVNIDGNKSIIDAINNEMTFYYSNHLNHSYVDISYAKESSWQKGSHQM